MIISASCEFVIHELLPSWARHEVIVPAAATSIASNDVAEPGASHTARSSMTGAAPPFSSPGPSAASLWAPSSEAARNHGKPLTGPDLERFLPWHADPRNLRAWAQPPPPG